jgi:XTP/dITP diphosphohydrolase
VTDRLVLLVTSPRLPPGLLTLDAWTVLRAAPVCCGDDRHPQLPALAAAGVAVDTLIGSPAELARAVRQRARGGTAVWLAAPDGDPVVARALAGLAVSEPAELRLETVAGSYDPPGARLLDAVAVMDRLRSPGGCPWDGEQTHASLAPYLLEEAYEAYQAVEDSDLEALRDELGDLLLQVVFHARLAVEDAGWDIDDVAGGLVDKLVRRHPHVFGTVEVNGAAEVQANWDEIKAAENGGRGVVDGVPLSQPALALAAAVQKRAARVGLPAQLWSEQLAATPRPEQAVAAAAAGLADADVAPTVGRVGDLLFAAVALARSADVDPEAALRGVARRFRDRLAAAEAAARSGGRQLCDLGPADWAELWRSVEGDA